MGGSTGTPSVTPGPEQPRVELDGQEGRKTLVDLVIPRDAAKRPARGKEGGDVAGFPPEPRFLLRREGQREAPVDAEGWSPGETDKFGNRASPAAYSLRNARGRSILPAPHDPDRS